MISVAAELAGMHPQTLRIYEQRGLIEPEALAEGHAPLLAGRRRAAAADPGADVGAGDEPRRRRARVRARGASSSRCGRRMVRGSSAAREQMQQESRPEVERVRRCFRRELVPLRAAGAVRSIAQRRSRARPSASAVRATGGCTLMQLRPLHDQVPGGDPGRAAARARARNPQMDPRAPARRAARAGGRHRRAGPAKRATPIPRRSARARQRRARRAADGDGRRDAGGPRSTSARSRCSTAPTRRRAASTTSTSRPSTCCSRSRANPKIDGSARRATCSPDARPEVRGPHRVTDPNPEDKYQALEKFGRDLTEAAEQGKLDPVIGRDDEIRRVIQVLSRRTKNNPVLIGEPGRRQDGDRRGPRAADRLRRRARVAARPARRSRSTSAR